MRPRRARSRWPDLLTSGHEGIIDRRRSAGPPNAHLHARRIATLATVILFGLEINDRILAGVTDAEQVSWTQLLLAGPAFLVVAFAVLFWAARGIRAIKLLATYRVKPGG
jgi:hypothetical protein